MASITTVVASIRPLIRDNSGTTFSDAVLQDAVRAGIRATFPSYYEVTYTDLGTKAAETETLDISASVPATKPYRLHAVEYYTRRGWKALRGVRGEASAITFPPLERSRKLRLVLLEGVAVPSTVNTTIDLPDEWLDVATDLALIWLYEGYAAGRVPYDKFTVTSADDAIGVYEVHAVVRQLQDKVARRVSQLQVMPPALRVM